MSKPAAAFFDLDGTLVWRDESEECTPYELRTCAAPTEKVAAAVQAMVDAGNYAFICTGRSMCSIHPELLKLPWTGLVTLYGGYVVLRDEILRDVPLTPEVLADIVQGMEECKGNGILVGTDTCVETWFGIPALGGWDHEVHSMADIERIVPGATFGKIFLDYAAGICIKDRPLIAKSCAYLEGLGSGLPWSELAPKENDKMLGVRLIMEHMASEVGTTYGFGDSDLDLPLLRACDVAVAVGNASAALKAEADYVAPAVQDDGVAEALEHFGLLS